MNIQTAPPAKSLRSKEQDNARVELLLEAMTLDEKIGQLQQLDAGGDTLRTDIKEAISQGSVGAVLNQTDPQICKEMQRIAVEETRLGIPLLHARDVIHGFTSIFPIPLAQAATWNPDLIEKMARISALEAAAAGIHWTFAPMIDISRDARWGRIAESFGEDPYLTGVLGVAAVTGYQGDDLSAPDAIAACAKHFAGYGASEAGLDYNTTNIPENELRNVYLPPFKAVADKGIASFMSSFSDIDGIPATANRFLLKTILRDEWGYEGLTVSDWNAISELSIHGLTENDKDAALQACRAGIDMEMVSETYSAHLKQLLEAGDISLQDIDAKVRRILLLKIQLGLFEYALSGPDLVSVPDEADIQAVARQAAIESMVLMKNDHDLLPLSEEKLSSIAVIGPLADAPREQLGTWIFDGDIERSISPLVAIRQFAGKNDAESRKLRKVIFAKGLKNSRAYGTEDMEEAVKATSAADCAIICLGEEAILSGEAHCRADIRLPGAQLDLLKAIKDTGKPVIAVILAGRPIILDEVCDLADAVIFAWHPGMQTGPALCDIVFGKVSPSGKLPVTFPKSVGQIPIYYNHKNTGRPPSQDRVLHISDIEEGATQTSFGMTAFHLDDGFEPQFPFGFGLSYARFEYSDLSQDRHEMDCDEALNLEVNLTNTASVGGTETVQLYIRDHVGSLTRPVRELKQFKRIYLKPGEKQNVKFTVTKADLSFYRRDHSYGVEKGRFSFWIGGDSSNGLSGKFVLL